MTDTQGTPSNDTAETGLSRRQMLHGLRAAAAAAYAGQAAAASAHHDHSRHTPQQPGLLNAVYTCLDQGRRCIAHCPVSFNEGDTTLAACAAKVHVMHAVCDAFSELLGANSDYIKGFAAVCRQVCNDCEQACLTHDEPIECQQRAQACADVVDQIALALT